MADIHDQLLDVLARVYGGERRSGRLYVTRRPYKLVFHADATNGNLTIDLTSQASVPHAALGHRDGPLKRINTQQFHSGFGTFPASASSSTFATGRTAARSSSRTISHRRTESRQGQILSGGESLECPSSAKTPSSAFAS